MSLDNYDNLKISIRRWARRNDIDTIIDDVIDLVETEIYSNPLETLRVKEMDTRATATTGSTRFLALPDGYLSMRRLLLTDGGRQYGVNQIAPEAMKIMDSGRPKFFATTSQLEFDRIPEAAYTATMQYYKKPDGLSSTNQTNIILTNYPTIYLFGGMWACYKYASEAQKADENYESFIGAIKGANKKDRKGRYSAAPAMRVETSTP